VSAAKLVSPTAKNRIVRSSQARRDLIQIWQFIAHDSEIAADRFLSRIEKTLAMLRDNPLAGRARPELATKLRSFPVGNYVLFYRPLADGIDLTRVLSSHQDIQPDTIE
jgi:toxin ParE1/3/4